ncbi:MAG: hypothetical protein ACI81R_000245, partial [Bradymonadia bacterium]
DALGCNPSAVEFGGGGGGGGGEGGGGGGGGGGGPGEVCGGFPYRGGVTGGMFFGGGVAAGCGGGGGVLGAGDSTGGAGGGGGGGEDPFNGEGVGGGGLPIGEPLDVSSIPFDVGDFELPDVGFSDAGIEDVGGDAGACCYTEFCEVIDDECEFICGDGVVDEEFETCDGNCPTTCEQVDRCEVFTDFEIVGSPDLCDVSCFPTEINSCEDGDGCCPFLCNFTNDDDCEVITGDVGSACNVDTDCGDVAGGFFCQREDYLNGYCTYDFGRTLVCPEGSQQTSLFILAIFHRGIAPCVKTCESDADCEREEYSCYDIDFNGTLECERAPEGPGEFRAPCDESFDCGGGEYVGCSPIYDECGRACYLDPPEGQTEVLCPADLYCSTFECVAACETCYSGDECCPRERGCQSGVDTDCEAPLIDSLGQPCLSDTDCLGVGGRCLTDAEGYPGGLCTVDIQLTNECPGESGLIFYPFPDGSGVTGCHFQCDSTADCRGPDYQCVTEPFSDELVCRPVSRGSGAVGTPCETSFDCAGGEFALCDESDHCSVRCAGGFSGTGVEECPAGSTCNLLGQCGQLCDSALENCPSGQSCFPGALLGGVDVCVADGDEDE